MGRGHIDDVWVLYGGAFDEVTSSDMDFTVRTPSEMDIAIRCFAGGFSLVVGVVQFD